MKLNQIVIASTDHQNRELLSGCLHRLRRNSAPTATAAATVAAAAPAAGGSGNRAELISMVPNNQQTARVSQAFQLTFTLKNTGTTVWTPNYKVVHVGGTKMSATDAAPLNGNVGNGQTGTATFYMTAPKDKGTYTQNFNFIDPWNAVILPLSLTIVVTAFSKSCSGVLSSNAICDMPVLSLISQNIKLLLVRVK